MLNETQLGLVIDLRAGNTSPEEIVALLKRMEPERYQSEALRELYFALDATKLLSGVQWHRLFVDGLVAHGPYLDEDQLLPKAYAEIGEWLEVYGRNEISLSLVVQLYERSTLRPNNADSFTRRCFREHINGITPVSDFCVLLIERFFGGRELSPLDLELVFHIIEETKGLNNCERTAVVLSLMICGAALDMSKPERDRHIFRPLIESEEESEIEMRIIEDLKARQVTLPNELLQKTDLTLEKLAGLI